MMRSMYSGVSGLKTHQTKMDVIGNNIANVNTVAYKNQSITFSELMYQTTQKSSGPNALTGTGGTNARQIGLGVKSAAINTAISSQGATQTTGNPFDLCITGESFFIVNDGSGNYFTRAGAFNVDSVGNLVMSSNGYNVMGWGVDPVDQKIKPDTVQPLRIMSAENLTYPPEASYRGYLSGILDKNDPDALKEAGKIVALNFYDNLGYSYTAKMSIHATQDGGNYYVQLDDVLDSNNKSITEQYDNCDLSELVTINGGGSAFPVEVSLPKGYIKTAELTATGINYENTAATPPAMESFTFPTSGVPGITVNTDESYIRYDVDTFGADNLNETSQVGKLLRYGYGMSDADVAALREFSIDTKTGVLTIERKDVVGAKLQYKTTNGLFDNIDSEKFFTLDFAEDHTMLDGTTKTLGQFKDIEVNWEATTMYNNSKNSTIGAKIGDKDGIGTGRKNGKMTGVTIQTNGMIYASYDNGMTRLMGQIAVAEFSNAAGLEKAGDNLYNASLNSGEFDGVGVDITGSGGYMTTGVLEMSNVDLSAEFTEMITTQRGFQANSRIITVSDTMLEELVNLKR